MNTEIFLFQVYFWSTESRKDFYPNEQCVTFGSSDNAVKGFTIFYLIGVYFIPVIIMSISYSHILYTIIVRTYQGPRGMYLHITSIT